MRSVPHGGRVSFIVTIPRLVKPASYKTHNGLSSPRTFFLRRISALRRPLYLLLQRPNPGWSHSITRGADWLELPVAPTQGPARQAMAESSRVPKSAILAP